MINFTENIEKAMEYLHRNGAFLTVKNGDNINTMTISWGNIGFEWARPIFTVLVRKSRYTHEFLNNSNEFTVSIPLNNSLNKELAYCGSKSGKDVDKIRSCSLTLQDAKVTSTPIIGNCGMYYECKIVYHQEMDLNNLSNDIKEKFYNADEKHELYYGEIVSCYQK